MCCLFCVCIVQCCLRADFLLNSLILQNNYETQKMVNCRRTGLSTPTRLIDKMHLKISAVFYPVECYAFLISQPEKQLIKASL